MPLTILSERGVSEYVSSLDLSPGTDAYRTLNAMLLLSKPVFTRAISALAQGLVTFTMIRSLPAINDRLVESLINDRLGLEDVEVKTWKYLNEWLSATIDLTALRKAAVGDPRSYLTRRFHDLWGEVVKPRYDFLKMDETAYHSYIEAQIAYLIIAGSDPAKAIVQRFADVHQELLAYHPHLLPTVGTCPVKDLIDSLSSTTLFLERPGQGRMQRLLLDYLTREMYIGVSPGHYDRFMQLAAAKMASVEDLDRFGVPGATALRQQYDWTPFTRDSDGGWGWRLARSRMARIYLPSAYGSLLHTEAELEAERATDALITNYLAAARTALISFQKLAATEIAGDASRYRALPGSSMGLLLCFTNS